MELELSEGMRGEVMVQLMVFYGSRRSPEQFLIGEDAFALGAFPVAPASVGFVSAAIIASTAYATSALAISTAALAVFASARSIQSTGSG